MARIRRLMVTPGAVFVCPQCSSKLRDSVTGGGTMATYTLIYCDSCRRSMVLKDLPRPSQA